MLKFFKEHNVKLAISIDGPQDITDFLRGKGSYAKVMQGLETAKRINYNKIECSATYTKCHEELGYTYNDINGFFKSLGVKATISRVLSNDEKLLPVHRLTKEEIKTDIWELARIIYDNHQSGGINPYLYRTLMSLAFGSRSINYCDDLMRDFSIAYDYDGTKYNCFHFWGDKKYALEKDEVCNAKIQETNCKNNNEVCVSCWAKYLCKICVASIMQNIMEWPFKENGECKDRDIFELCMECIIEYHLDGKIIRLMDHFVSNYVCYQ